MRPRSVIASLRLGLVAGVFLAALAGGAARSAPADSTAVSLRGVVEPLPRPGNPLQHIGRGLLAVPYAAVELAAWPLEKAAVLDERWHLQARVSRLGRWAYERTGFHFSPILSFESRLGLSPVGFEMEGEDRLLDGDETEIHLGYFSESRSIASLRYLSPERPIRIRLQALRENEQDRPFFGLGPNSPDDLYGADRRWELVEGSLLLCPAKWTQLCVTGYWRDTRLSDPSDEESVREAFPTLFAEAEHNQYAGLELGLLLDGRDRGAFSTRGTMLRLLGGVNEARTSDDPYYRHYALEAQEFVPLDDHERVLAFRLFAEGVVTDDPTRLPYTEQSRLGGKRGLRGSVRDRFTDLRQLLLTAEYRYPVTQWFVGRLFGEWGGVASRWADLKGGRFEPTVGLGLMLGPVAKRSSAQVAWGEGGWQFYFGSEAVFDFISRRVR